MNTSVSVTCSNENLQVTSTYTGSQPSEGTLTYEFIYDGTNWLINEQITDLSIYDLIVIGTPVENDTITLVYTTLKKTIVNVDKTNTYSSTGIKPITGTGVAAALSTLTASDVGALPDSTVVPIVTDIYNASSIDGMSGIAVANAVSTKEDKEISINILESSGTVVLTDNSINTIAPSAAVTFTLPNITDTSVFHQILIQLNMSTVVSMTLNTNNIIGELPDMTNGGKFNIFYEYRQDLSDWTVGIIAINN